MDHHLVLPATFHLNITFIAKTYIKNIVRFLVFTLQQILGHDILLFYGLFQAYQTLERIVAI
ncbi:MAG: hypothetical protein ACSLEL_02680 [Candidatus Malihini olakiniferum]